MNCNTSINQQKQPIDLEASQQLIQQPQPALSMRNDKILIVKEKKKVVEIIQLEDDSHHSQIHIIEKTKKTERKKFDVEQIPHFIVIKSREEEDQKWSEIQNRVRLQKQWKMQMQFMHFLSQTKPKLNQTKTITIQDDDEEQVQRQRIKEEIKKNNKIIRKMQKEKKMRNKLQNDLIVRSNLLTNRVVKSIIRKMLKQIQRNLQSPNQNEDKTKAQKHKTSNKHESPNRISQYKRKCKWKVKTYKQNYQQSMEQQDQQAKQAQSINNAVKSVVRKMVRDVQKHIERQKQQEIKMQQKSEVKEWRRVVERDDKIGRFRRKCKRKVKSYVEPDINAYIREDRNKKATAKIKKVKVGSKRQVNIPVFNNYSFSEQFTCWKIRKRSELLNRLITKRYER